ncbi:MAG TPA: hypothetical protein VNT52_18095 [Acidimicrobiales bacterium]|nr:hypothetical protein [Acidimicrobiales bacterium]
MGSISGKRQAASADMRWSEAQLRRMFARAEELGHTVSVIRVRQGVCAMCSCTWQSNPRKRPASVLVLASLHIGAVLGDGEVGPMSGPVPAEAPAPVAPHDVRRVAG